MAAPSITELPEKTINGFVSKWNASNLPIQYVINNDKFPVGANVTNYFTQILIFVNGLLVATIEQVPDPNNNTVIDIKKFVQSDLKFLTSFTGERDTNASAEFYIEGSEEFIDASGIAQSNAITGAGSGVVHFASMSGLQFGNTRGGNMYDHVLDSSKLDLAQWMTFFERGQLVDIADFLLSIIVNTPGFNLEVIQFDINGNELSTTVVSIANNGLGVYRLNLDNINFKEGIDSLTVQAIVSVYSTAISEVFTIDVDFDCTDIVLTGPFDLTSPKLLTSFSISSEDNLPENLWFNSDGTKFYFIGSTNRTIFEYHLTSAWNLSTTFYSTKFLSISAKDTFPFGLFLNPDSSKMFFCGSQNNKVYEYDLSIPGDISTGLFGQDFPISEDTIPRSLFFKPDGLKMYVFGLTNRKIFEYDLSVSFDVSTAVLLQESIIFANPGQIRAIFITPDGDQLLMVNDSDVSVIKYAIPTAWDIASIVSLTPDQEFNLSAQDNLPYGVFFKPDGSLMYVAGQQNDEIYEYSL